MRTEVVVFGNLREVFITRDVLDEKVFLYATPSSEERTKVEITREMLEALNRAAPRN